MASPLLIPAAGLVLGIWAQRIAGLPSAALWAGLAAGLAGAWILQARGRTRAALAGVAAAAVFLGAAWLDAWAARYDANPLRAFETGVYADLTGTLYRSISRGLESDMVYLRIEQVDLGGEMSRARGHVRVSVPHSREFAARLEALVGDRLVVGARFVPPREYRNFREPFSRDYLRGQGIHALAATKSPLLVRKAGENGGFALLRPLSIARRACLEAVERAFPSREAGRPISPEGAVLEALLLGERGRMDADLTRSLQETGLFHLFAISGAHIAIVSVLLFGLLRILRVSRRAASGILIVLLAGYGFLVEGRSSVFRAVIMGIAYLAGRLLWKDVKPINTIALSGIVLLLANPFQLFDLGFQLTFAACLGLVLIFPLIRPPGGGLVRRAGELLVASLAAQAAVFPLIAAAFNRVALSALALNMIGIPLVGLIMAAGYAFLPAAILAPGLGPPAAAVLTFLIRAFVATMHSLDGVPGLSGRVPTPSPIVIAGYYLALAALVSKIRLGKARPAAAAGLAVFAVLLALHPFPAGTRDLRVTFLDVGQGDAALIEFPGSAKMLIDGGGLPTGTFDIGENVVSPYLWARGIKRLDILVLTHPHPDHLNGLPAVARNFRVGEFWEAGPPEGEAPPAYARLHERLGKARRTEVRLGFAREIGGVRVEALWPAAGGLDGLAENDRSLVLRLSHGAATFLFAADVGAGVEAELETRGADLTARVLKSGHHGSAASSSPGFLAAVRPETVVISAGRGNAYGLPAQATLERCEAAGVAILRTDLDGAVEIRSDGRRLAIRTSARGWLTSRPNDGKVEDATAKK